MMQPMIKYCTMMFFMFGVMSCSGDSDEEPRHPPYIDVDKGPEEQEDDHDESDPPTQTGDQALTVSCEALGAIIYGVLKNHIIAQPKNSYKLDEDNEKSLSLNDLDLELLSHYVHHLDPRNVVFSQEDVTGIIEKYDGKVEELLHNGDCRFIEDIADIHMYKNKKYLDKLKKYLKSDRDLQKHIGLGATVSALEQRQFLDSESKDKLEQRILEDLATKFLKKAITYPYLEQEDIKKLLRYDVDYHVDTVGVYPHKNVYYFMNFLEAFGEALGYTGFNFLNDPYERDLYEHDFGYFYVPGQYLHYPDYVEVFDADIDSSLYFALDADDDVKGERLKKGDRIVEMQELGRDHDYDAKKAQGFTLDEMSEYTFKNIFKRSKTSKKVVLTVQRRQKGTEDKYRTLKVGLYRSLHDQVDLITSDMKVLYPGEDQGGDDAVNVGVLKIRYFYTPEHGKYNHLLKTSEYGSAIESASHLTKLYFDGMDILVLDLRGANGDLGEVHRFAKLFFNTGNLGYLGRRYGRGELYSLEPASEELTIDLIDLPLVVLVDKNTAAAGEIFAHAVQTRGRGIVVGDSRTRGQGAFVHVERVHRGNLKNTYLNLLSSMIFTQNLFVGPDGSSVQGQGVKADVVIPSYSEIYGLPQTATASEDDAFAEPHKDILTILRDGLKSDADSQTFSQFDLEDPSLLVKLRHRSEKRSAQGFEYLDHITPETASYECCSLFDHRHRRVPNVVGPAGEYSMFTQSKYWFDLAGEERFYFFRGVHNEVRETYGDQVLDESLAIAYDYLVGLQDRKLLDQASLFGFSDQSEQIEERGNEEGKKKKKKEEKKAEGSADSDGGGEEPVIVDESSGQSPELEQLEQEESNADTTADRNVEGEDGGEKEADEGEGEVEVVAPG